MREIAENFAAIMGVLAALGVMLYIMELFGRLIDRRKYRRWEKRQVQRVLDGIKERTHGIADDELPAFLRPQAGPLCNDEHFERVVTLRQLGV